MKHRLASNPALLSLTLMVSILLLFALSLFSACGRGGVVAPVDLKFLGEREILEARQEKDRAYRLSEESPIPPESRAAFEGIEYYPYDPDLRFVVHLERYAEPVPFTIVSTQGEERPAVKVGYISFDYGRKNNRLEVYSLRDLPAEHWDSLFLPFRDETTGVETYGAGRYVELANGVDDWYVLDFNTTYNPLCVYGRTIYRCPSTPSENHLSVAIRAGERGTGSHATGGQHEEAGRG